MNGGSDVAAGAPDFETWAGLGADELLPLLVNDLEPAAFSIHPTLAELRATIERQLARPLRMSGSGSSLFTLFDDEDQAKRASMVIDVPSPVVLRAVTLCPAGVAGSREASTR
jgi:4-diphosphocytidyl-2C-methyl-D-erythritol kinase